MQRSVLATWTGTLLLLGISSARVYGQPEPSETTVRDKITTVRETITTTRESSRTTNQQKTRLVAIFVKNRAGRAFQDKLGVFEDLITAEITDMGFQVMSPEDTLKAVRSFLGTAPDKSVPGAKLDELLDNNTSAVRLAQNMGVEYLFVASMATFGKDSKRLQRPELGIDRQVTTHKLRTVYKILDAGRGESISAGTILSSVRSQATPSLEESTDVINDLLADASIQIAERLRAKGGTTRLADSKKTDSVVEFSVKCTVQDFSIPDIRLHNGYPTIEASEYKQKALRLEAVDVTVELDGVVIGTAPGTFNTLPGLHKILLTRVSHEDLERTISIRDGLDLTFALEFTPQGRKNMMGMARFFSQLKRDERMAEADAELVKGYAQMLRQSGYRIDRRSDVKINTTDAPTVNQTNVDQQNVAQSVWP